MFVHCVCAVRASPRIHTLLASCCGAGVILNPGREPFVYGKVTCSPQLAAAVIAVVSGERMDWRSLGLKIALYDMLR